MNNLVLSLVPKFIKLQTLILRQENPQLKDDAVETISKFCHDLQDLDLSKSFKLSDCSLYALAHGCPNLQRLNISGCTSFSDEVLAYLTNFCRKLKVLNLCGCVKAATDHALQAIGRNCNMLQSSNLGWCDNVGDHGVMSLANGCPDLRCLDLCGYIRITDDSVIALANECVHLRSLGLYYCRNITDRAIYSLAQSRMKNKCLTWESMKGRYDDEDGLKSPNISQCTALTTSAVQALCDTFPALHTCSGRHSLVMSGCLNLTSVHCACAVQAHRTFNKRASTSASRCGREREEEEEAATSTKGSISGSLNATSKPPVRRKTRQCKHKGMLQVFQQVARHKQQHDLIQCWKFRINVHDIVDDTA
ncbi:F-box protein SKP2A-like [Hibiscus syriacus]|uniref:F-box protein SKP2A-like n=1 Tax=Hibiscus syriacus TaxID=106335 RepID=UPI0019236A63|nr:F-box protein SKP2A-like [Hibiscus syriacus]